MKNQKSNPTRSSNQDLAIWPKQLRISCQRGAWQKLVFQGRGSRRLILFLFTGHISSLFPAAEVTQSHYTFPLGACYRVSFQVWTLTLSLSSSNILVVCFIEGMLFWRKFRDKEGFTIYYCQTHVSMRKRLFELKGLTHCHSDSLRHSWKRRSVKFWSAGEQTCSWVSGPCTWTGLLLTVMKAYLFTVDRASDANRKQLARGCTHMYVPGRGKPHVCIGNNQKVTHHFLSRPLCFSSPAWLFCLCCSWKQRSLSSHFMVFPMKFLLLLPSFFAFFFNTYLVRRAICPRDTYESEESWENWAVSLCLFEQFPAQHICRLLAGDLSSQQLPLQYQSKPQWFPVWSLSWREFHHLEGVHLK